MSKNYSPRRTYDELMYRLTTDAEFARRAEKIRVAVMKSARGLCYSNHYKSLLGS